MLLKRKVQTILGSGLRVHLKERFCRVLGNKSCLQNCITECRDTQKRNTTLTRRLSANVFLDRARGYNEIEDNIFILFTSSQTKDKLSLLYF